MAKTKEQWLKESDYWDQFSLEELVEMSEPVEWQPIDDRPKKAVSLRLSRDLVDAGKSAAAELGIGYQTLFRMWLLEGLRRHRHRRREADRRGRSTTPGKARSPAATRR